MTATMMLLAVWAPGPASADDSGRVDLNQATVEELAALPRLTVGYAKKIIALREQVGGFRCVEEMRAVQRIPEKVVSSVLPLVMVTGEGAVDCKRLEEARRKGESVTGRSADGSGSI